MELISVHLARLVALIDVQALDPTGKMCVPQVYAEFSARYNFFKGPSSIEEMDLAKGIVFSAGHFEDLAIDEITLYPNGIVVDTRSSTDNAARVFDNILSTARESWGATVQSKRRHYVSQLYFSSKWQLSLLNPLLQKVADHLSSKVSSDMDHPIVYEPSAILINMDTSQLKITPAHFTLERKAETPFCENTYYSAAPLGTTEHWKLLTDIESSLL